MKTFFAFFLACILLLNWSCKKNDSPSAAGDRLDSLTIRKLSNSDIDYTRKYSYDASGKLVMLNHANGENIYTFTYDPNGQLLTAKLIQDGTVEIMINSFIYDGSGKIILKTGTPILPTLEIDDHSFAYDNQQRLISDTQHFRQTSIITGYRTFAYDANNDVTEQRFYTISSTGTPVPGGGIAYTYDDKLNPFDKIRVASYMTNDDVFYLSKHNVVSTVSISGPGLYLTPTTYTYTSNDLPQTATYGSASDTNSQRWEFIYN